MTIQPEIISEEALPAVSASTQIFANVPDKCEMIQLTVRGGTLTIRFDNGTATATNGCDYPAGTYDFYLPKGLALKVKGISSSVSSGWIQYFKPLGR